MPIDTHVRVAAWLHIVFGALAVLTLLFIGMFFAVFGAIAVSTSQDAQAAGVLAWIGSLGAVFLLFFIAIGALQIAGGVLLLRGNPAGRVITIIFSVLSLVNIPIGTIAGAYSLWALLREVPQPSVPMPAPVQPGHVNTF
ncbi:MAG: hypothetical protein H7276_19615 [Caulobacter sp.]|nr:hypothetical protein [Vitreoscilla sp.]